ncbi:MAG: zinc ribbon domain-containing protein [Ottowia sp.]|uniref:Zn-ribbon domain-containing OB-fold protein n=1 Tax=Ottowia sp. TaxID=1898956 RepID=UPI003C763A7A
MNTPATHYLPSGLPAPVPEADGLSAPYWKGLQQEQLLVQRCTACGTWQFGPEWICHHCHSFDLSWVQVAPRGTIFSWERAWHPVHPALHGHGPYLIVLVELAQAGRIRMVGNLLGDPAQEVRIGTEVTGVFEHHLDRPEPFSLLHWRTGEPVTLPKTIQPGIS